MTEPRTKSGSRSFTMVMLNSGIFLVGELVGGNKLLNPRTFQIIDVPKVENNLTVIGPDRQPVMVQQIHMGPLPGLPDYIMIRGNEPYYPIPAMSTNIIALYERVTSPPPEPEINAGSTAPAGPRLVQ